MRAEQDRKKVPGRGNSMNRASGTFRNGMKVTVAGMQTAGGRRIEAREVEKMTRKAKHSPEVL